MPTDPAAIFQLLAGVIGGGVLGTAFAVGAGWIFLRSRLAELRSMRALADKAEAEAAETPIGQWRVIVSHLQTELERLSRRVDEITGHHIDCEKRTAAHEAEIKGLRAQNSTQQLTIDQLRTEIAALTARVLGQEHLTQSKKIPLS